MPASEWHYREHRTVENIRSSIYDWKQPKDEDLTKMYKITQNLHDDIPIWNLEDKQMSPELCKFNDCNISTINNKLVTMLTKN